MYLYKILYHVRTAEQAGLYISHSPIQMGIKAYDMSPQVLLSYTDRKYGQKG
jgi:hypothetical protein